MCRGVHSCTYFNARTGEEYDYVVNDNSTYIPIYDEYDNDIELIVRKSKDTRVTEYGRKLLDLCKTTGVRILNGRVGDDTGVGKFTFHCSRGSSLVDYIMCSVGFMVNIIDFKIIDVVQQISDHNMLTCTIATNANNEVVAPPVIHNSKIGNIRYVWNNEHCDEYKHNLSNKRNDINSIVDSICHDVTHLDNGTEQLSEIIRAAAHPYFRKRSTHIQTTVLGNRRVKPPYYSADVEHYRDEFVYRLELFRTNANDINRQDMTRARRVFKNAARKARLNKAIRDGRPRPPRHQGFIAISYGGSELRHRSILETITHRPKCQIQKL